MFWKFMLIGEYSMLICGLFAGNNTAQFCFSFVAGIFQILCICWFIFKLLYLCTFVNKYNFLDKKYLESDEFAKDFKATNEALKKNWCAPIIFLLAVIPLPFITFLLNKAL